MASPSLIEADITVVGAGAAGLYAALNAARAGARVALVSATPLAESASYWAQGGLAAALAFDDSPQRHLEDTVAAGRGAVRESAALVLCADAPARVRDLETLGVRFDADRRGRLALGLEGGHSKRRVAHAGGSATGRRVTRQLSALVAGEERIEVLERRRAASIWSADGRCVGCLCDDGRAIASRAVVLATGGAAALWSRTTNPPGSFGAGLLIAHAAGAELADLELMQFHPTAVAVVESGGRGAGADGFLVTQAIRGEGAELLDAGGERFVDELAPRDEVARAIELRLRETGTAAVLLDMRQVDARLFPNVVSALRRAGIYPEHELVPVAPAAHYLMGGIATDLYGRSSLPGLYAVGECACTGLHGANRLASNSLTECFVFGHRAALASLDEPATARGVLPQPGEPVSAPPAQSSRENLWRLAGLERSPEGLTKLLEDPYPLARLVAACALARAESRGAHWRTDHPAPDPALDRHHAVVRPTGDLVFERWE